MDRKIVLSEQNITNLVIFLDRVPTTGWKEASALVELIAKIKTALLVEEKPAIEEAEEE